MKTVYKRYTREDEGRKGFPCKGICCYWVRGKCTQPAKSKTCEGGYYARENPKRPGKHERLLKAILFDCFVRTHGNGQKSFLCGGLPSLTAAQGKELIKIKESMK